MRKRPAPTAAAAPAVSGTPRRAARGHLACVAAAALLAVVGGAVVSSAVAGQETADGTEVRIVARKLDTGRIEFGLQQRQPDDTWGDRQLPNVRFFPTTATIDRWLASSPLELTVGDVRIVARKLETGRIEFGLQQRQPDDTWGDRQLPNVRFFPTTAGVNRWLASSPLTLAAAQSAGQYAAITVGDDHSCALRTDGTITCWGNNWAGEADAPDGQFTAVTAGGRHSCGLRTDGTITCWGLNGSGAADAPDGQFTAVTAGASHSCGQRTDGTHVCWSSEREGQFTAIGPTSSGTGWTCDVRTDDTVDCWYLGRTVPLGANAPDGPFTTVVIASSSVRYGGTWFFACGLRNNGTIACWDGTGLLDVPEGQFTALVAGGPDWDSDTGGRACGLRTDGTIACLGGARPASQDGPEGQFTAMTTTSRQTGACGLRTDGTITCWALWSQDADAPPDVGGEPPETRDRRFTAIAAGDAHYCALGTDGGITCWGLNGWGQSQAPAGQFSAVTAGGHQSCGLRTDGTITCWGESRVGETSWAAAPEGVRIVPPPPPEPCGLGPQLVWGSYTDRRCEPQEEEDGPVRSF